MGRCPCFGSRWRKEKGKKLKDHEEESEIGRNLKSVGTVSEKSSERISEATPTKDTDISNKARTFTFRELAAATKNFREETFIGQGGFGTVYRGKIISRPTFFGDPIPLYTKSVLPPLTLVTLVALLEDMNPIFSVSKI